MVTEKQRGKQGSWVLLLSFLLTLGELFQLPETQFVHLQNRREQVVTVRQNLFIVHGNPRENPGTSLVLQTVLKGDSAVRDTWCCSLEISSLPCKGRKGWKNLFAKISINLYFLAFSGLCYGGTCSSLWSYFPSLISVFWSRKGFRGCGKDLAGTHEPVAGLAGWRVGLGSGHTTWMHWAGTGHQVQQF